MRKILLFLTVAATAFSADPVITNPDTNPLEIQNPFTGNSTTTTTNNNTIAPAIGTSTHTPELILPTGASTRRAVTKTDALILGLVEGITEYLPISSTGHLIIAENLLRLDDETVHTTPDGEPIYFKKPTPKKPNGQFLTTKLAIDAFCIVIQFGAIAAIAILYWKQIVSMLLGLVGRDSNGLRLLINLIVAFIPAAIIGLLAHDWIETHLFSTPTVIAALVVGALIMIVAERWRKKNAPGLGSSTTLETMTPHQSLLIGLFQCLALWPGMSRSMTTIVGGYLVRLSPKHSAEFSFLLGLVTLSAATLYKTLQSGQAMLQVLGPTNILIGTFTATITAILAVRFLVTYLTRHGLLVFAIYRLIIAAALTGFLFI